MSALCLDECRLGQQRGAILLHPLVSLRAQLFKLTRSSRLVLFLLAVFLFLGFFVLLG